MSSTASQYLTGSNDDTFATQLRAHTCSVNAMMEHLDGPVRAGRLIGSE